LKLIKDVFQPQAGEVVLVMVDLPHGDLADSDPWRSRRKMAAEWHAAFEYLADDLDLKVLPLLTYPATGSHNSQLPEFGEIDTEQVHFEDVFQTANLVVAMTEFSASAPLVKYSQQLPAFRAASMPMVGEGMMETALAADYQEIAQKCGLLLEALEGSEGANLVFSTGDELFIDLRHRKAEIDDGQLPAGKKGSRVINLPSGEVYIAPYEGEISGQPSQTHGTLPIIFNGEPLTLELKNNRITRIAGIKTQAAAELEQWLDTDDARRNLAELGLGCNDRAVVTGNVLEDEKVLGVHLAAGLSDHIGGSVGPDDFSNPLHVVHYDLVYPFHSELYVEQLSLIKKNGTSQDLFRDGAYTVFSH
jgi:hypothetical protein